ncbi:early nodulin-75 isoform X3 [Amborella trichopoda]|uniref:early nodulin-75 isoform X3 n=1 Tax=Amborella trichopoda TaxID=13333 RepID=UPI0009BF9A84|nr:early nodulin-75 isoform X3 [Amborella trichopoda]|eukprot:XP_020521215.1 early nodulin-75 isoform X3 [Amborella trichopoda]
MNVDLKRPGVTEIQVRMDCNGCVQKIRKALHGIHAGIYDVYIDFPQQKLTVVGWVDPERVMKAIRKTRKLATICTHIEPSEPKSEPPPPPAPDQPPPDPANPPPPDPDPPAEPPAEEQPPPPPPPPPPPTEEPKPEVAPPPEGGETGPTTFQEPHFSKLKEVQEVRVMDYHPRDYYYYPGNWHNGYTGPGFQGHGFRQEYPPRHAAYAYETAPYVPGHGYVRLPAQNWRPYRTEYLGSDYPSRPIGDGANITSMFSDENPNACSVM